MTVIVELPAEGELGADEVEQAETAPETSEVQRLAALLAQAYVAVPLFA